MMTDQGEPTAAEMERLKASRRSAKASLTRACTALAALIQQKSNVALVQEKLDICQQRFEFLAERHREYEGLPADEAEKVASAKYWKDAEHGFVKLRDETITYVQKMLMEEEQKVQDAVRSHDSVSRVSSRGTKSSFKSALAKARAKGAALKAEAEHLQRLQQIEMRKMSLEHEERQAKLEAQIKMAEAEELAYEDQLSDASDAAQKKSGEGKPIVQISKAEGKASGSDKFQTAMPCRQSSPIPGSLEKVQSPLNPLAPEWSHGETSLLEVLKDQQRQHQTMVDVLQLPKTELPRFDGDPLSYYQFVRAFDNVVDRAHADHSAKLARLVQYCTGKAKKLIECCLVMRPEEGYTMARKMLEERFGNPFAISNAWIKQASEGQPIRNNDATALQDFADTLKSCRETLDAMGLLSEVDTQKSMLKIVQRLPAHLQNRWRRDAVSLRKAAGRYPSFWELVRFVEQVSDEANDPVFGLHEAPQGPTRERPADKGKRNQSSSFTTAVTNDVVEHGGAQKPRVCSMCEQDHTIFACGRFKQMTPEERLRWSRSKRLCDNCLLPGHIAFRCRKPTACTVCNRKHTRFLHIPVAKMPTSARFTPGSDLAPGKSVIGNSATNADKATSGYVGASQGPALTALPVVPVRVKGQGDTPWKVTYALIDGGSTNTFCSEELLRDLSMQGESTLLTLTTLEKEGSETPSKVVSLEVTGINEMEMITLPRVYSRSKLPVSPPCVPSQEELNKWTHLRKLKLPHGREDGTRVDLLIGQDVPEALVPIEVRRGKACQPYAVRYLLGWTLNGPLRLGASHAAVSHFVHADAQRLNDSIERFWRIDHPDVSSEETPQMSLEDRKALSILVKSTTKVDGHYQMAIPFKDRTVSLPNNRSVAETRLESLKRRLLRDDSLHERYSQGIADLLAKGYAEPVDDGGTPARAWYLPHHPVFSSTKSGKVRVVFDCSAKCQGTSLNDQVLQGPDLTNGLLGVLLRFREGSVAVMGDVEAMYHQVCVPPSDRDLLRFLWWRDGNLDQEVINLRMTRHLFGGVWSACAANHALRKTVDDNAEHHDALTVETARRSFYVDDCLRSVDSRQEAIALVKDLRGLLARGGFNLTKWISNDREVMESIPGASRASTVKNLDLAEQRLPTERALGVRWNVETDQFELSVKKMDKPLTRRGVTSTVCSIYDPFGLVAPLVLPAKLLCQELSRLKLGWDDPMPDGEAKGWIEWQTDMLNLKKVSIPRCMKPEAFCRPTSCQLHHFADASQVGYGAVSYLRLTNADGEVHCSFVIGKARLAPLKMMTIPRLELSAAVIAAKLDHMLRKELQMNIDESYFWTDSQIVLQYLKNDKRRFHTFVANRVSQVHEVSDPNQWRHVRSAVNPADVASRGLTVEDFLKQEEWFIGPAFLYEPDTTWCTEVRDIPDMLADDPEVKRIDQVVLTTLLVEKPPLSEFIERYSSWIALKKAIAWLLRLKIILSCRLQKKVAPVFLSHLTVAEMVQAEGSIIRYLQGQTLSDVESSKHLKGLNPELDSEGILCVGGRLENAPVHQCMKRQMILPKRHHVVTLIIRHLHKMSAHAGLSYVLSLTRERYWIIGGRRAIKKVLKDCIHCKKLHAHPAQQKMEDLPEDRVQPFEPAFTHVGVDCFGPFNVKRGRNILKRYGCIFTCLVIRAVHIEVLHSLDAHSFLNALHRFMARRGQPQLIRSDNGSNFTASEKELREALKEWNESNIPEVLVQRGVTWKFNPPASSHMGGAWERQIRSVRKALNSLKDEQILLDDEGLTTLMCLAEAVVNGRPITMPSDDPRDCEALTPNHLLLLKPGSTLPPGVFTKEDFFRRRWRQAQYLANVFWRRWVREYLPTLQRRQRWLHAERNISVGDLVLVMDENTPRGLWPLGRVISTHPGKDGLVRSVQLKTKSTTLTRPIRKLCLLESVNE